MSVRLETVSISRTLEVRYFTNKQGHQKESKKEEEDDEEEEKKSARRQIERCASCASHMHSCIYAAILASPAAEQNRAGH